jgi:homoserine kinase type II
MAAFTKLTRAEIEKIAKDYHLKVSSFEPIVQGAGNSNYVLVTDHGKFILTIFEIKPKRVINMTKALLLLAEHQYPTHPIYYRKNGEVLTKYKNKLVMVRPFVSGNVVKDLERDKIKQVGTALGKLHDIPAPEYLPEKHPYLTRFYFEIMQQEIDVDYKRLVKKRFQTIANNAPPDLPVGIAHGDLFYDNMLFENGKLKAILDFEELCRIEKVNDLGMTALGTCVKGTDLLLHKVEALIDGYQEIRDLEIEERDFLQMSIEWSALITSTWRFWKYNIDTPDGEKADGYLRMVDISEKIRSVPTGEFIDSIFT